MNKASWVIILLFALSSAFAQDTTIVKTDTIAIKFACICNGLYKNKSDLDSCKQRINKAHESLLKQYKLTEEDRPNSCNEYYLPYIDFSKNNLIITRGFYGGCVWPKVESILYKITSTKKYKLMVKIIERSFCKANIPVPVYLLTPKFEEGYTFEQEIINTGE